MALIAKGLTQSSHVLFFFFNNLTFFLSSHYDLQGTQNAITLNRPPGQSLTSKGHDQKEQEGKRMSVIISEAVTHVSVGTFQSKKTHL